MSKCKKCTSTATFEEGYCREHYYELYKIPLDFHKFKERKWRDFLRYFLLGDWGLHVAYDKQLEGTKIKPDIHFFFLGVLVVIEIDEHQHKLNIAYEEDREEARYSQLSIFKDVEILRINTDYNLHRPSIFTKKTRVHAPGELSHDIDVNEEEFRYRQRVVKGFLSKLLCERVETYKQNSRYFQGVKASLRLHYLFYD